MSFQPGTIIVNADDFGMSSEVNQAIIRCFNEHLISSATLMANMAGFNEACELIAANRLSDRIGVHLNLTEGTPLTESIRRNRNLCDQSGTFRRFRPFRLTRIDAAHIAEEIEAQIDRCRTAGITLTHADSHQHVHTEPMVFLAMQQVLKRQRIRYLRITRNLFPQPTTILKRSLKTIFNTWLRTCGLSGTDYLGTVVDFQNIRKQGRHHHCSVEILTHPSLTADGTIIDHLDGQPLTGRLAETFGGLSLSSYAGDTSLRSANAAIARATCISEAA